MRTPSPEQRAGPAAAAVGDAHAVLMLWPALFIFFQLQVPFGFMDGVNVVSSAGWEGRRNVTTVFDICYFFLFFLISGFIKASSISSQIHLEHL